MEVILYYIKESGSLLISFLILMFVVGFFCYMTMRNFRQDSKVKVGFYGLFLGISDTDIVKISVVVLRTFLVFYAAMITTESRIYMCLIMIAILSLIYIILYPSKLVYETVTTLMQGVMIYFIYTLNGYMIDVEYSATILGIRICLIVFSILLATYFLLRDINDIIEHRWDKDFEKSRKELEHGKEEK